MAAGGVWDAMHQPPVDRGRAGSKRHLLVDAGGIPLAVTLTGGNRNDLTQLIPLLKLLHARPVAGKPGRPQLPPPACKRF